jgi:hypothetical protein
MVSQRILRANATRQQSHGPSFQRRLVLPYTKGDRALAETHLSNTSALINPTSGSEVMAARFCSECGERLKTKRLASVPFRSFCVQCSPRFKRVRWMLIGAGVLCAIIGFAAGRYTNHPGETFHFIGTPLDVNTGGVVSAPAQKAAASSSDGESPTRAERLVIPQSSASPVCGARTRSGKSCQRRVKGGGYCWQHREKSEKKSS